MRKSKLRLDEFTVKGISIGSSRSSLMVKPGNFMIDVGYCFEEGIRYNKLLLTHAHVDHAADLVYYISQRKLMKMDGPTIYLPKETKADMEAILQYWQKIEMVDYNYSLVGVEPGMVYKLDNDYHIKAVAMNHRIPAVGYSFFRSKKKLKPEYLKLSNEQIRSRRESLEHELFYHSTAHELFFSGDTNIQAIAQSPEALNSRILFLECTFVDEKRDAAHASNWGHVHLDDICSQPKLFENNRHLVLYHFSRRYQFGHIQKQIELKCGPSLQKKIKLFY